MPEEPYIAHVVSHTHWDREWYRTFQIFRMRLVALTDDLLDLFDRDPDYRHFYWDGQTVVIDDYLEIRPENAERLRQAFRSGRLTTGPWFVQPDEFLVSGESFIRNLQLGGSMCRRWETGAAVGYAPDAFGHTSQMPQILQGFGIDNAVLFRGITTDQVDAEFTWQAPDGTQVLCVKMPDSNAYSNFFYRMRDTLAATDTDQPLDEEQVIGEATQLLEDGIRERPTTRNLLWMDGVDHIFAQPRTPEIIRIVNRRMGDRVQARHSTLPEFLADLRASGANLQTVTGELRHSNRAWNLQALLTHVASSRIHTKQQNHECETLLERYAEPLCAFAWKLGADYPEGYLRYAWRQLLLNQPHDSICGCSIDQVHRDMLPRYEQCRQVARKLAQDALTHIAGRVDTATNRPDGAVATVVAFNPLGWERNDEIVDTVIEIAPDKAPETIALVDPAGKPVAATVEAMPDRWDLRQAPHDIPVGDPHRHWHVRFQGGAPGIGCRAYYVVPGTPGAETAIRSGAGWMENDHLRVDVAADGTFTLTDRASGAVRPGMLAFQDGGDVGDGYNYRAPKEDAVLTTTGMAASVDVPVVDATGATIRIRIDWNVPAAREGEARSAVTAPIAICAALRLENAARRLDIHVDVTNAAADHRLRALFPSGERAATAYAVEQAFDVCERSVAIPECPDWREPQPATGPQKTFADVSSADRGLCVINRGLPEVEVIDDRERTVAVTLLRCTGGGVGGTEQQTDGQMLGTWAFDMALFPHTGSWQAARAWREAHSFNAPMVTTVTGIHGGTLPAETRLATFGPDTAVPTCVKRSEDGTGLVLRAVNYGDKPAAMSFCVGVPVERSFTARLDETRIWDLPFGPLGVTVEAPARRIVTVVCE